MHSEHDGAGSVSVEVNRVGTAVMDAAFAVHRALGAGLLESVYEHCLAEELFQAGFAVDRQAPIPAVFAVNFAVIAVMNPLLPTTVPFREPGCP